jgi:hypothetical protein
MPASCLRGKLPATLLYRIELLSTFSTLTSRVARRATARQLAFANLFAFLVVGSSFHVGKKPTPTPSHTLFLNLNVDLFSNHRAFSWRLDEHITEPFSRCMPIDLEFPC